MRPKEIIAEYAKQLRSIGAGGTSRTVEIKDDFYIALMRLQDAKVIDDVMKDPGEFPMPHQCLLAIKGLDLGLNSIDFVRSANDCLAFLSNGEESSASSLSGLRDRLAEGFIANFPQSKTDFILSSLLRVRI